MPESSSPTGAEKRFRAGCSSPARRSMLFDRDDG
jgi:hypothetical protein